MEYWNIGSVLHRIEKYHDIALGSCGEFHSCNVSCKQADQITADDYERLDQQTLIQTLKLCVFDHYSKIPTFHHSM